uniref:Uncharacterized protein n=1 Tax=Oryctolagus cuniculus TaxID=9986 RepID=A0A5F9CMM3_RABIT
MMEHRYSFLLTTFNPSAKVLVHRAQKLAQQHYLVYQQPVLTAQLVGVRPFRVSVLLHGWNERQPYLFPSDPPGAYFAWKATAIGKNYVHGKTFLETRYEKDQINANRNNDKIKDITKIWNLKRPFTQFNVGAGICNEAGFRKLTPTEVKHYVTAIAQ